MFRIFAFSVRNQQSCSRNTQVARKLEGVVYLPLPGLDVLQLSAKDLQRQRQAAADLEAAAAARQPYIPMAFAEPPDRAVVRHLFRLARQA